MFSIIFSRFKRFFLRFWDFGISNLFDRYLSFDKVTVIGGGSFGTTIANILAQNGYTTYLWCRRVKQVQEINKDRRNTQYCDDLELHSNIFATNSIKEAISKSKLIFIAVPGGGFRETAKEIQKHIKSGQFLISTSKGVDKDRFILMSEVLEEEVIKPSGLKQNIIGVLSGPNIAKEIMDRQPAATVIASENMQLCKSVKIALENSLFYVFANKDRYGVELGGLLKNIYAIASGLADGLDYKINTKSFLITRSSAEIIHFSSKLGANPMTFLGLAGMGDLIATCLSENSRNYRFGKLLAKYQDVELALNEINGVVEGLNTIKIVFKKSEELNVDMPILWALYQIIYKNQRIKQTLWKLLKTTPIEDVAFFSILKYSYKNFL